LLVKLTFEKVFCLALYPSFIVDFILKKGCTLNPSSVPNRDVRTKGGKERGTQGA